MKTLQVNLISTALLFIYIVLILVYGSVTLPLIILLSLPLSVAGSFIALFLTGNTINICSILGIVMSIGIASKNGVILLDFAQQLMRQGVKPLEAIHEACKIRLRPILMTSFGVLLTTLPIVIAFDEYSKVQVSLGIALIGGLITSTILTLLILPAIFRYAYPLHEWAHRLFARSFNPPPTL